MIMDINNTFSSDNNCCVSPSSFYSWRYDDLGDLSHVATKDVFRKANTGLVHTYQMINVEDFEVRNNNFMSLHHTRREARLIT